MNALTLPASRRRDKVVILRSLNLGARVSNPLTDAISRALPDRRQARRLCLRAFRRLFSARACAVAGALCLGLMAIHTLAATEALEAQRTMATDVLLCSPWLFFGLLHATLAPAHASKKGGEK